MMIRCLETGKKATVRKDSGGLYLIKDAMSRLIRREKGEGYAAGPLLNTSDTGGFRTFKECRKAFIVIIDGDGMITECTAALRHFEEVVR
jgi:hypothetical protein